MQKVVGFKSHILDVLQTAEFTARKKMFHVEPTEIMDSYS